MRAWPIEAGQLDHEVSSDGPSPQQGFLAGNDLPRRWRDRAHFVVLETGFGRGANFLATWAAWRADARRCQHLHFVALEHHPLTGADLAGALAASPWPLLAQSLVQQWPPLTPHLHALCFDENRVSLLLAFGEMSHVLPALRLQADAFYLHGFAGSKRAAQRPDRVLKALGRKAAAGATLVAASVRAELRQDLSAAGFVLDPTPATADAHTGTLGRYQPRQEVAGHGPVHTRPASAPQTAVVVGAGLAGAAAARALARQGLQVTVLEAMSGPATRGSGNPAGLFHGTVNADDGPYARLFRTAALAAQREYAWAVGAGRPVSGSTDGLLRLETGPGGLSAMQAMLARQGLPAAYVQALSADAASALAGVPLPGPAWFYPGGGWICPPQWVLHALATPGVQTRFNCSVAALRRQGAAWQTLDAEGQVLAQADVVVLAHTQSALKLLQSMGHAPWPVTHSHGQLSHWADDGDGPRVPVAGDGYVLRLPAAVFGGASGPCDGRGSQILCGATQHPGTPELDQFAELTTADHRHNLERARRLTGLAPDASNTHIQGRAAWRLHTADRLPIAGAVPCIDAPTGQRLDQARLLAREPGLFVLTALGARGLTWAPLLAQLVAAQACGTPWPLEQDLADAIDPARWRVRAVRRSGSVLAQLKT